MHTWWRVVCDEHKEMTELVVATWPGLNVHVSSWYGSTDEERCERETVIGKFLDTHIGCKLRLVHQDIELDDMWQDYHEVGDKLCHHCRHKELKNESQTKTTEK